MNLVIFLSVCLWGVILGVGVFFLFFFFAPDVYSLNRGFAEADGIPGELLQGKRRVVRFFLVAMQSSLLREDTSLTYLKDDSTPLDFFF